jgi:pyridoxal biosynthesis lyase PdxS
LLFHHLIDVNSTIQSDPAMIKSIVDAVTIPVMAKVRIGHFVEAQASPMIFIVMPTRLITPPSWLN